MDNNQEQPTEWAKMKYGEVHVFPNSLELPIYVASIGINHCHDNFRNLRKKSDITALGYVINGQGEIQVNSEKFRLQRGDAFILKKDSKHLVKALPSPEGEWTYYWYSIRGNSLPLLDTFHLEHRIYIPDANIETLFRKGMEAVGNEGKIDQMALLRICTEIIMALYPVSQRDSKCTLLMHKIKQYLDGIGRESFSSEQLSRQLAMSFKQLNRIFKQNTGNTIYQYVLMRKINIAMMMLKDTDMTVCRI